MNYVKLNTNEVNIGDLKMGGIHPIRVQSMTTADTLNTEAVVEECIRLIQVGCEMIRITAPSLKDAENLLNIKKELKKRGYAIPLCADIHYTPNAAELAARIVEKVRINPGNYADKKKFEFKEYSDIDYQAELERIREKFLPLVKVCKEYGTAMRIGTNHGSLSDRILSRYGDTPQGMVESAMEFVRICEDEGFRNIVISMKASNPLVMIEAYRLLVSTMIQNGTLYPIHLGVTEAGDGEDGRIKSAIGIGTLLEDGIGDTVRVSLTEPPEKEIPAAKKLVEPYNEFRAKNLDNFNQWLLNDHPKWRNFQVSNINKNTEKIKNIGKDNVPVVIHSVQTGIQDKVKPSHLFSAGYIYNVQSDKWNLTDFAADYVYIGDKTIEFELPGNIGILQDYYEWKQSKKEQHYPVILFSDLKTISDYHPQLNFVIIQSHEINVVDNIGFPIVWIVEVNNEFYECGKLKEQLKEFYSKKNSPIIFKFSLSSNDSEKEILEISKKAGYLFTQKFGNGIMITNEKKVEGFNAQQVNRLMFDVLQGLRERISKTEYIACPSCGRTLFDLQETTQRIKEKTAHLKGLKIGIMGCIVNGPGEMADADFGYVGTGPGKVSLYKGHTVVKRNIPEEKAVDELINLIKEYGMYREEL
ncbi:MAG: 4-hydroxy-3-methylbut-2-en-1-yl diphosphate synthase (flavodoxin) [Bacteroidia bacterium]|nr:MAG: 4-hydroxy-3-methylbut-2-en-1-yl diphosphate synthase (flavodoxin) [Bacteroidia bacterium]